MTLTQHNLLYTSVAGVKALLHTHTSVAKEIESLQVCTYKSSLPARFETFQLLYKEAFKHLGTLKEGRVIGVVVAAVVKDFGHVGHKLGELVVMPFLQTAFHCGKV